MNLGQLEVLVATVEAGSLTEAGDMVGLTQSAVSRSLSKLEAELGVTLLERGRQGVTVTHIGEEVLQHARIILGQAEIILQKAARAQGFTIGKVRFGAARYVPPRVLTGILRNFQQQYPDIDIVLFEGNSTEIIEWLHAGIVDVGTVPSAEGFQHTLPMVEDAIHVILPLDHPLAARDEVRIDEVRDEPFIGVREELAQYKRLLPPDDTIDIRYQVSEVHTILTMVAEGMGVSILPRSLITPDVKGVIARPLAFAPLLRFFIASTTASPNAAAFMRVAHDWSREHGFLPR